MSAHLDLFKIILDSGLVVKLVLLSLVVCSIASWTIIAKKKKFFSLVEDSNREFLEAFSKNQTNNDLLQKAHEMEDSTIAHMFKRGHEELVKINEKVSDSVDYKSLKDYFIKHGSVSIERALKKGMMESSERLESTLSTLASIASVAPFIGLLGTVWGIIDSFTGLSAGGTSLDAVAPGIAEALVATAVGLFAAIPAVWFYNAFNAQIGKMSSVMDSFSQDYLNFIERTFYNKRS